MFPMVFLYFLALVVVAITHWVYKWRNPKCNGVLPPGSMGFPFIGESLHYFSPCSLEGIPPFIQKRVSGYIRPQLDWLGAFMDQVLPLFIDWLHGFLRYGTLIRTSIVGQRMVVSTDPEINQYVFQQEGKLFQCWYTESARQITGEQGLTVHSGEMHKESCTQSYWPREPKRLAVNSDEPNHLQPPASVEWHWRS
ncbi:hypothetical protein ACH5RR_000236 [Cinchona calisaya]|uniref:Cytochrome P450 n=1 Tax=Cinchona calisaya TaxID=153742 RepID=A0ABD3B0J3_9GENT